MFAIVSRSILIMVVFTTGPDDEGRRLDRVLRRMLPTVPLPAIYRALRTGRIRVEHRRSRGEHRIRAGEVITIPADLAESAVTGGAAGSAGFVSADIGTAETEHTHEQDTGMRLEILAQGPHLIAVNKPTGLATHGPKSLQHLIADLFKDVAAQSLAFRPAPLHRLDRGTSGVVICAASMHGARQFSQLLRSRQITKWYLVLLGCVLEHPAHWLDRLHRDRRSGLTRVVSSSGAGAATGVLQVFPLARIPRDGVTLAAVKLETGRRHQIRAQAAARGCPLDGDLRYGSHRDPPYLLHAMRLEMPGSDRLLGRQVVMAPLPDTARTRICRLFGSETEAQLTALFTRETLDPVNLVAFSSKRSQ